MIDKIRFDANGPTQEMGDEHFRERGLLMDRSEYGRIFQSHDDGFRHRRDRRYANPLPGKTSFAEEFIRSYNRDDGFLALLRNDRELGVACLYVEYGIGRLSLRKDDLVLAVITNAPPLSKLGEKRLRIDRGVLVFIAARDALGEDDQPRRQRPLTRKPRSLRFHKPSNHLSSAEDPLLPSDPGFDRYARETWTYESVSLSRG